MNHHWQNWLYTIHSHQNVLLSSSTEGLVGNSESSSIVHLSQTWSDKLKYLGQMCHASSVKLGLQRNRRMLNLMTVL